MSLTKEIYLCSALKCFQKMNLFFIFYFNLDIDGEIGGNLSMIGTATLNSLGLKEKANLMPRGEKRAETVPTPPAPSFPPEETHYISCAYFTDIW